MIKGSKTKLIEKLYKGEIKYFAYEIYYGSDSHPHVRTFVILNDDFNRPMKLEELGQVNDEIIQELKQSNYIDINKEQSPTLKKVA